MAQLPFSSINYGTCDLLEGRLVTKSVLDVTYKGTGKGETSIFPCQIFQLKNGINTKEGEPNYDLFKLAIKCTSRRLYPNYMNCDWSNADDSKSLNLKTDFIDSLSTIEREKLIHIIEEDPSIGKRLGLQVVEE